MSNVKDMRIFSAEQIEVPDLFPGILKNFIKEVVRRQPEEDDHVTFSRQYFESLINAGGLAVDRFEYGRETDGQSLYVLRRR